MTASPTALVVWLLAASSATAGTIQISISSAVGFRDGEVRATVSIANSGDEAALALTPSLRFAGLEAKGETAAALPPGTPLEAELAVPVENLRDGRWPFEIIVEYADLNQYPFEALQVGLLRAGNPPAAKVALMDLESEWGGSTGSVRVQVKNLADQKRRVRLRLIAPGGVEVLDRSPTLELSAWENESVEFELVNRMALAGNRLPVFATAEYDDGPLHHAVVISGSVEIQAHTDVLDSRPRALWIAAGVLGLAFVGLLVLRFLRR